MCWVILRSRGVTGTPLPSLHTPPRRQPPPPALADAGSQVQVLVDGTLNSVYSDVATVDVVPRPDLPVIVQAPQDAWVPVGASTTLAVVATSTSGPLSYQWKRNGANIQGATSDTCVQALQSTLYPPPLPRAVTAVHTVTPTPPSCPRMSLLGCGKHRWTVSCCTVQARVHRLGRGCQRRARALSGCEQQRGVCDGRSGDGARAVARGY